MQKHQMTANMDQVIPLHLFDDNLILKSLVINFMFVFRGVLDPKRLVDSLEALARVDGWQKLGARLRRAPNGRLEYHIPAQFTQDRPAVLYRHSLQDMPISKHPAASLLPSATKTVSITLDSAMFKSLARHIDMPQTLEDYLSADIPQVGLYVVSFQDATAVSLVLPHTLCDGSGVVLIMQAWVAMMRGEPAAVPLLYGMGTDPLAEFGCGTTEAHKLDSKRMSMSQFAAEYVSTNLTSFMTGTRRRLICIPASFINKTREQSLRILNTTGDGPDKFISDADIIYAWWSRMLASQLTQDPTQTLVVKNLQSFRHVLSPNVIPKHYGYLSNAINITAALIPMKTVLQEHVGVVASQIRHAFAELSTRSQAEAYVALFRQCPHRFHPMFGVESAKFIYFSNLTMGNFFDFDFGAALVETDTGANVDGAASSSGPKSRKPFAVHYWDESYYPNIFVILGKDVEGNYWMSGNLTDDLWDKIQAVLAREQGVSAAMSASPLRRESRL